MNQILWLSIITVIFISLISYFAIRGYRGHKLMMKKVHKSKLEQNNQKLFITKTLLPIIMGTISIWVIIWLVNQEKILWIMLFVIYFIRSILKRPIYIGLFLLVLYYLIRFIKRSRNRK